ncbi:uncharacterized protein [Narcine bancroftii]|uniref:uncharacterized protein isoform X2 n=1 Tax=Narcine bancroftii TaxID=1343680 RepID=UPI00383193FE
MPPPRSRLETWREAWDPNQAEAQGTETCLIICTMDRNLQCLLEDQLFLHYSFGFDFPTNQSVGAILWRQDRRQGQTRMGWSPLRLGGSQRQFRGFSYAKILVFWLIKQNWEVYGARKNSHGTMNRKIIKEGYQSAKEINKNVLELEELSYKEMLNSSASQHKDQVMKDSVMHLGKHSVQIHCNMIPEMLSRRLQEITESLQVYCHLVAQESDGGGEEAVFVKLDAHLQDPVPPS